MTAPTTRKIQNLKPAHEIVALLEARGCSIAEIAEATGYSYNYVWRIRTEIPEYKVVLSEIKREIKERVVEDTADAISMLNAKVPTMIDNLEDLALAAGKEGVRLRATMDWLDRAPDAPKRVQRQENSEERKIIFSVQQVENMKLAAGDIGASDIVDLIEGQDYLPEPEPSANVINVDEED